MSNVYTYVILNATDVTDQQIADCAQTSRSTLRLSLDGTLAVLKYVTDNEMPDSLQGLGLMTYTQDEAIAITTGSAWM